MGVATLRGDRRIDQRASRPIAVINVCMARELHRAAPQTGGERGTATAENCAAEPTASRFATLPSRLTGPNAEHSFQMRHPGVTIAFDPRLMGKFVVIAIAFAVAAAQPALAWGDVGHEIIASIARDRTTSATKARVDAILAKDTNTHRADGCVPGASAPVARRQIEKAGARLAWILNTTAAKAAARS